MLIRLPHEWLLAELLIFLRQNRRIAYYVGNDAIEMIALDLAEEATGHALVAAWQQQHPEVPAEIEP